MEKEHREPWEALSLIAAAYLAWLSVYYVITVMDYAMAFMTYKGKLNLRDCIEIPFLL